MLLGHDKIMFFTQYLKARRKQTSNIQVNAIFSNNKIDVNKKFNTLSLNMSGVQSCVTKSWVLYTCGIA